MGYLARKVIRADNERKEAEYHNLGAKAMERNLGASPRRRVINPLLTAGVIEVNEKYAAGRFSKGYRLSTAYRLELIGGDYRVEQLTDKAQLRRFSRWKGRRHEKAMERFPHLQHQLDAADHFTVDLQALDDYLRDLELCGVWRGKELTKGRHEYLTAQAKSMAAFFDGSERWAHFASGRIHTALTNTPRDLRQFIIPKNGDDLIEGAISEYHCPPCEEEEWLTTKKICARLDTSEPTLRKMRRNGGIRYIRVGQSYRYQLP